MYRVTPITYFVKTLVPTGLAGIRVTCATDEILKFDPAGGQSCGTYLKEYISTAGGYVTNPDAIQGCLFCPVSDTDTLLAAFSIEFGDRWRSFGISLAYSVFNVVASLFLYWLARVPKRSQRPEG